MTELRHPLSFSAAVQVIADLIEYRLARRIARALQAQLMLTTRSLSTNHLQAPEVHVQERGFILVRGLRPQNRLHKIESDAFLGSITKKLICIIHPGSLSLDREKPNDSVAWEGDKPSHVTRQHEVAT